MTDEKLIAALISTPTVREAAKQAGVSESAVYKKLRNYTFRTELSKQRALLLEDVRTALQSHLLDAISAISEIITNKETAPQTRLNACESLLRLSFKLNDQIDKDTFHTCTKEEEWALFNEM